MFHQICKLCHLPFLEALDTEALSRITNGFTVFGLKQQNPLETVILNHIDLHTCRGHCQIISGRSLPVSFVPLQADVLSLRAVSAFTWPGQEIALPTHKTFRYLKRKYSFELGLCSVRNSVSNSYSARFFHHYFFQVYCLFWGEYLDFFLELCLHTKAH